LTKSGLYRSRFLDKNPFFVSKYVIIVVQTEMQKRKNRFCIHELVFGFEKMNKKIIIAIITTMLLIATVTLAGLSHSQKDVTEMKTADTQPTTSQSTDSTEQEPAEAEPPAQTPPPTSAMQESNESYPTVKPSAPEFTLEYVDQSYDVPPTYGIDQFTGEKMTTREGYHVDERLIRFSIKNQAFTPYEDADGNNVILYYNIRFKGPYGDEWFDYPDRSHMWGGFPPRQFPDLKASGWDYTGITVKVKDLTDDATGLREIPTGIEVQFQVQAIIGYIDSQSVSFAAGGWIGYNGERSDWSDTQTVIIG
jgi:hypothetical protein